MSEVSTLRLYVLRAFYLLNFAGLSFMVWPSILSHEGAWDPLHGVAFSFWAALGLLMGLGIRYPLKMLPVVFIQLVYKSIWIAAVLLPAWSAGQSVKFTDAMIAGVVADLIVIPWPYVVSQYVRQRGDRRTS
jgi:hypothetical protein